MITATCLTCGTKSAAAKKFCAECGTALPLLCLACGNPVTAGQKFCDDCGAAIHAVASMRQVITDPSVILSSAPATVTDRAVTPPSDSAEEERRLVTALFCDLVGFTPLSEQLDPEEVRGIQAAYFAAMGQQIERYGGIVEKYAGDAILALFGVPTAHEDDPERAVLCALGMQRAIGPVSEEVRMRHGTAVSIRVGVNTGEVVSGSWNASGRQQVAVTGASVNTAARIQTAAEPGGVLVGAETMHLTRHRIHYGPEQQFSLKGKTEAVRAYAALGSTQLGEQWESGVGTRYGTPLVGRVQDLETILSAWQRANTGEGQLLTLVGEPGVGKSRLVTEGIERITASHHPLLLRARCLSYGQSVSLWLIASLLRSLCSVPEDAGLANVRERVISAVDTILSGSDATDRAIAIDVLGEMLGLSAGGSLVATASPQVRRTSLIRILGLVLGSLTEPGSVLLVLEDLHWLDTASQEILTEVLRAVPGRRVLILATQRPGWAAPWSGWGWIERLTLRPLGDREAVALAGAVLGGMTLSPELEAHLRERAEGIPFFVEELLQFLQETGGLDYRDKQVGLHSAVAERLPSTLTEVLLARLDRLESPAKEVAQVGSVIGRSFAVRLLARVMEQDEVVLDGPLRALQEAEIAFPRGGDDPKYIFKHVTVRDVAYGMLVQRRRRDLHLAVARAIAQLYPADEYVEIVAYHFARTEEDHEAAEWLERAGDRARDAYADDAAVEHYHGALKRLERLGGEAARQARVEEKLGEILNRLNRHQEAEVVLERALQRYREAGDLDGMGRAGQTLGAALDDQGRPEEAQHRLEVMADLLAGRAPSAAAAWLQVRLSRVFHHVGRYGEMLAAAERVAELAQAVGDDRLRGVSQLQRGTASLLLGRIDEGREALEEAIPLLEESGDLWNVEIAVVNLGMNRLYAGATAEALQLTQRGLDLAVRTGYARTEVICHLNLALILTVTGEWERAREYLARAEDTAGVRGAAAWVAPMLPLGRGELSLRNGDWPTARVLLDRAVELAAGVSHEILELAETARAELMILEGRAAEARDRLKRLVTSEGSQTRLLLPTLAWAHLELGETERALELAEQAERGHRALKTFLYLPEALRIRGMALRRLGRHPEGIREARTMFTEGRERAAAMPSPFTEARILIELGLLDHQEGQVAHAREQLQEALAIFQRLGAGKEIARAEQVLTELERSADPTR